MATKIIKSHSKIYEYEFENLVEVPEEQPEKLAPNDELDIIGKSVSRLDGEKKVTGKAEFTFDKFFPNMTYAVTLRSPHANAKIKSIDTSKAEKLDGVIKIISSNNDNNVKWYSEISALFDKHVRFEGDEVACICAESIEIANKAKELIVVSYEILKHSVTIEDSLKIDAPKIQLAGNTGYKSGNTEVNRGDFKVEYNNSEVKIEDTYTTSTVVHNPTEPHCSVVYWENDELVVWDSTQAVFWSRGGLAKNMGIPENKIRYIKEYMGGGFGSKLEAGKYSAMAALISKEIKKPVKIYLDRKEMNLAVGNRPNSKQSLKMGLQKNGKINAISHHQFGSPGAYPGASGSHWASRAMYKCDNIQIKETGVLTNAGKERPFRAPGMVQGFFAFESFMDKAANEIGMDPLELRLKNYAETDPNSGNPYSSKFLKEAYEQGAKSIDWYKRDKVKEKNSDEIKYGIGMASQFWWGTGMVPSKATLRLNNDGSATVHCGTQDIGTGTYTFIAMIVEEILDIPMNHVMVKLGDTKECPIAPGSGGSLTAPSVSPAVYDAALQMKNRIITTAAALMDVNSDKLTYKNRVVSNLDKSETLTLHEVIAKMDKSLLEVTGNMGDKPKGYSYNSFGAQFAKVSVNVFTGQIKVHKVVAAHDIGRVLNWKTLENQFHGGIVQGIGFTLMEERVIDDYTGKVLTTNLHDYKVPTIIDTPEIEVIIVKNEDDVKISPVSVKGIGEPAHIPTAGAISNAVYHAIGVQVKDAPLTPDKVLKALYN